jgi:translation initiation factor IF-1
MTKVAATVLAILPRGLYRAVTESGHEITVHVAGGSGRNFVRLVVGDRVDVELAARDRTRGRVLRKI